ncbi:hypothetical protein [Wenzhouxiangella limi]|uniref:hypothetical protein n=1 Tax=Wenzhouxiangella limi TaxID=2707351 RepID=UPI001940A8CF|nr:hypothetical protein [Wenzhouxiangella limi]
MLIACLFLAACAGGSVNNEQTDTLTAWENLVRWSEYDALIDFVHPEYLAAHPVTSLDIDRLHQFRVTEYRVRQVMAQPDGLGLERTVRIRLYHIHSARERVVDHREVWRYDEELEAWLLHSGLPDPRQR